MELDTRAPRCRCCVMVQQLLLCILAAATCGYEPEVTRIARCGSTLRFVMSHSTKVRCYFKLDYVSTRLHSYGRNIFSSSRNPNNYDILLRVKQKTGPLFLHSSGHLTIQLNELIK